MSLRAIESEIRRFLSTSEPEVICICGRWGVGKTFAWNRFLRDAQERRQIALGRYSYVSLFGVNSLDEFKYSIFENSVESTGIGIEPSLETMRSNTAAAAERLGRKSLWFLQQIPLAKNYLGGLGPVWFLSVKNTIVCIDDIERRGKGLDIRDVMGLASNLKEHKGCKVVLILNDEEMQSGKSEFDAYYEKLVDSTLKFAPTPEESGRIALTGSTKVERDLAAHCATLGISNIRLIKKIERTVRKVEPMLNAYDEHVLKQAVHSLALLGWCLYGRDNGPTIEYLKRRNSAQYLPAEYQPSANEAAWNALLDAYRFTKMDEFDLVLLDGIRDGYFDEGAVKKFAGELDNAARAKRLDDSFTEAWGLFHDSFDDNEEDVINALRAAFTNNVWNISPMNLSGTVGLFKKLNRPTEAAELIRHYIENHGQDKTDYDLERYPFKDHVTDPDVVRALKEKYVSFGDDRDPGEILLRVAAGWSEEDLTYLSGLPVDTFYATFRSTLDAEKRRKIISASLQFDRIVNASEAMKQISARAKDALKRIGGESRINALRVAKYGVNLDEVTQASTSPPSTDLCSEGP